MREADCSTASLPLVAAVDASFHATRESGQVRLKESLRRTLRAPFCIGIGSYGY
jgi:hypothetical protein